MKRQVVLDTETTGMSPQYGHRVIEIGCLEMVDRRLTGEHFHCYLNPEREVEKGALAVHGLTDEFLADQPKFADVFNDFITFVDGAELIIHNAPFDVGFLNHELILHQPNIRRLDQRCSILDTLVLARKKYPGQKNNLDALCRRLGVDNSNRDLHGALLDSELLAQVYLMMTSVQEQMFAIDNKDTESSTRESIRRLSKQRAPLKVISASAAEVAAHDAFMREVVQE